MQEIVIEKAFEFDGIVTESMARVMKMFGVDVEDIASRRPVHSVRFTLNAGDVCFITGPSGGGKSVLLSEIYNQLDDSRKVRLEDIGIENDRCLIDCFDSGLVESMRYLSKAGLSDVFNLLEKPANLSEGQKYRYRLARALASGRQIIFADEFCSNLDRITASVVAYKLARFARKERLTLILASSHDDLIADLAADIVIIKRARAKTEVITLQPKKINQGFHGLKTNH